jgi:hypothetical protein
MQPRLSASITKLARNLSRGVALVGLTALVYGCALDKAITPTSTHPTVSINVYPSGASTPAGWTCTTKGRYTICASEDPIDLTNDTDPVTIPWALIAQGWTFTSNKGIKVKGGGWHEQEVTPTQYTAYNRKDRLIYKYEINVTNGTDTVTWDPFIWNN